MHKVYSALGDDGYTGLLGPGRVPKYHPQPEACGALDEASAAMGQARAWARSERTKATLLESQRHLYRLMTELAATPETVDQWPGIVPGDVVWLEQQIEALGAELELPREFIVPGDSIASAALDMARAVTRRAERWVVRLLHEGFVANPETVRYLNRLSSLLFVLARYEESLSGVRRATLANAL